MQLKTTYGVRYISFDITTTSALDPDRPIVSRLVTGAIGALEERPRETFLPLEDGSGPNHQSFRLHLVAYQTSWRWTRRGPRRVTHEVWRHPLYAMWTGGDRMDAIARRLEHVTGGGELAEVVNRAWSQTHEALWYRVAEGMLRWWYTFRNLENLAAQTGIDRFTRPDSDQEEFLLTARAHFDHMYYETTR